LPIRKFLEIEQSERGAVDLVDLLEGGDDRGGVDGIGYGGGVSGQLGGFAFEIGLGEAGLAAVKAEELAVEGGEEPGFDLGGIAELVAAGGPEVEGLLGEIAGGGLAAGKAEGKAVEGRVMGVYDLLEVRGGHGVREIADFGMGRSNFEKAHAARYLDTI
jgi:hypothetical protein